MRRSIVLVFGCLLAAPFLAVSVASAQSEPTFGIDRLQSYEQEALKGDRQAKTYAPLIADERKRLRGLIQAEIDTIVQPTTGDDTIVEPAKAIDRQRQIVDSLTSRLNESTVDLTLLNEEEKLYKNGKPPAPGAVEGHFMITKSLSELLARKALLEEEASLFQTAVTSQQDRLQRLLSEDQTKYISVMLGSLWYLAIVFGVFWGEYVIRRQLIFRIPHRGLRYVLSKIFTIVVYLSLLFWLVQKVVADHPSFLTILAVIGAALVFMLQDVIKSIIGWFTYKGALSFGHRVHLGGYTGDVLDISALFTTILVARTDNMEDVSLVGKVVRIPNFNLLTTALINYNSTSDFESVELPIYIDDARQWKLAKKILEDILEKETNEYSRKAQKQTDQRMRGYYYSHVSPASRLYMEITKDRELLFLLCFSAPIGKRRAIVSDLLGKILKRFEDESIRLADPK